MNRKRSFALLSGLFALSLVLFGASWPAFAYHSGSESDLSANPELAAFRSYVVSDVRGRAADVARWAALGDSYSDQMARAAAADAARWAALGESYSDRTARAVVADAARWASMGESYSAQTARAIAADAARWAALGDSYSGSFVAASPEPVFDRSSYDRLSANPELLSLQKYDVCSC